MDDERAAGALVADRDVGHDVVAPAPQHRGVDAEGPDVVSPHRARSEVRRHDPPLREGRQPTAQAADAVEQREQRAGPHAAVLAAQVVGRGRAALEPQVADLAHLDLHVARDLTARLRSLVPLVPHGSGLVTTTRATDVRRCSLPTSTSSTCATARSGSRCCTSTFVRIGPTLPNER
ncbi:MAG: hypothetical protein KatS3mg010_0929 [Acidimicrobiia bacterium]|nr:MAG: hypothetical protein KatS3mg010_0929 [Acidimicrobiia bacterium]